MSQYLGPVEHNDPLPKSAINPYNDKILGDFSYESDKSSQKFVCFVRRAKVVLAESYALVYYDEETKKPCRYYGELYLVERKYVDKTNSNVSLHQLIEPTDKTIKKELYQ